MAKYTSTCSQVDAEKEGDKGSNQHARSYRVRYRCSKCKTVAVLPESTQVPACVRCFGLLAPMGVEVVL
jgi:hypothetical protein